MNSEATPTESSSELRKIPPVIRPAPQRKRAVWPLVLGIIASAFAGLQCIGLMSTLAINVATGKGIDGILEMTYPGLQDNLWYVGLALALFGLVVLTSLFLAGIGFIMRRRWGIRAARFYAVANFLYMIGGTVLTSFTWEAAMETAFENTGQRVPFQNLAMGFVWFGIAIGILITIGISLGILLWLRSKSARREWTTWQ